MPKLLLRENMSFLVRRYNKPKFKTELKGFAMITNPNMESETVPVEQADKYKEYIASVWENICENDPSMKDVPNEYRTVELLCQEVNAFPDHEGQTTP